VAHELGLQLGRNLISFFSIGNPSEGRFALYFLSLPDFELSNRMEEKRYAKIDGKAFIKSTGCLSASLISDSQRKVAPFSNTSSLLPLVDSGFRHRPCDLVVERFNYSEFIDD
jgi:hypothetical protein